MTLKDSPSGFPPVNALPSSRALRANGISSSDSEIVGIVSVVFILERLRETLRAREQSASESIPASVRRGSCEPLANGEARNVRRKRTTSSSISSSHRLSLSPSDARTRMSSARTGSVITCAAPGRVLHAGPSCSGVLNWEQRSLEMTQGKRKEQRTAHHISSLRQTISAPRTSMPMQSPRCAIRITASWAGASVTTLTSGGGT
jgi:hypothetical protein